MLSKMLALMADLENGIGEHYIRFHSNDIGLSVWAVRMKDRKCIRRTFSKQEISDIINDDILIKRFVEDAIEFINSKG